MRQRKEFWRLVWSNRDDKKSDSYPHVHMVHLMQHRVAVSDRDIFAHTDNEEPQTLSWYGDSVKYMCQKLTKLWACSKKIPW